MRKILGFAVLAVVAWLVFKIVFGVLGTLVGLAFWILGLAVIGYIVYMVLKVVASSLANRIKEMLGGASGPKAPSDFDRMAG